MDRNTSVVQSEKDTNDNTNQPDYRPDSQVDASFADDNLEGLDPSLHINNPVNAQVNINNPVMPAKDMVKLEEAYPGAIDRILAMGEKEQAFTHKIIESQHESELKANQRNIGISKEQSVFNFLKLIIAFVLVVLSGSCAVYLFINDKLWGGLAMSLVSLVLASIFLLGYFPNRVFEALFGKRHDKKPPDNIEE